jgi:hypothetical protein
MAPLTKCLIHNYMGTIQICDHLLLAVEHRSPKIECRLIDAVKEYASVALCSECHRRIGEEYDEEGLHKNLDSFPSNLVCYACYLEWDSGYSKAVAPSKVI